MCIDTFAVATDIAVFENAINGDDLQYVINEGLSPLRERSDIRDVKFFPYDADRIRITQRELQKKVTRILPIGKKIAFPDIMGIKQAWEITQGERFKAEIVSDCYDSKKGWKLKLKDKLS